MNYADLIQTAQDYERKAFYCFRMAARHQRNSYFVRHFETHAITYAQFAEDYYIKASLHDWSKRG